MGPSLNILSWQINGIDRCLLRQASMYFKNTFVRQTVTRSCKKVRAWLVVYEVALILPGHFGATVNRLVGPFRKSRISTISLCINVENDQAVQHFSLGYQPVHDVNAHHLKIANMLAR